MVVQDIGPYLVVKGQRKAYQLWQVDGPAGIKAGIITPVLGGGDHYKQAVVLPANPTLALPYSLGSIPGAGPLVIAPTPTPTQVPPTAPSKPGYLLNFEDLAQAEIPRIAWQDSQRVMVFNSQSFSPQVDLKIRVGPTTNPYFGDVEPMYRKAITFWARFDQPTIFLVLIYNSQDRPWAREQIQNASCIPQEGRDVGIVDAPCNGDICSGANAGMRTNSSVGLGVLGIHQPDSWVSYRYGPLQIHEYTHAVQPAPWIGDFQPLAGAQSSSPCWLNEGTPHSAGLTIGTNSYEAYLKLRRRHVGSDLFGGRPRVPSFTDFSPTAIVDYYDKSLPGQCYPP